MPRDRPGESVPGSGLAFEAPEDDDGGVGADKVAPLHVAKPNKPKHHGRRGHQDRPVSMLGRVLQDPQQVGHHARLKRGGLGLPLSQPGAPDRSRFELPANPVVHEGFESSSPGM